MWSRLGSCEMESRDGETLMKRCMLCGFSLTRLNFVNTLWGERMSLVVLNVKPHFNTHHQDHLTGHVNTWHAHTPQVASHADVGLHAQPSLFNDTGSQRVTHFYQKFELIWSLHRDHWVQWKYTAHSERREQRSTSVKLEIATRWILDKVRYEGTQVFMGASKVLQVQQ